MVETNEGIVLKNSDYQEKSKILQVFTKEHGLIGVYLKGANQYKSKAFAISQPISHAFFNINYSSGLSNCYNGEIIQSFQSLKIDFDKNVYCYHLFELLMKNLEQHQAIPYLYDLLLKVLETMENAKDIKIVKVATLFFELKLLHFAGVAPILSHCVKCGSQEYISNFDISRGGFVCRNCLGHNQRLFSVDTIKTLYELFYSEYDSIRFDYDDQVLSNLRLLVNEYIYYHLGMKTNSSKYFA